MFVDEDCSDDILVILIAVILLLLFFLSYIIRCSCGKCSTTWLQNANECCCCQDIEKCVEALSDEWVLEEMKAAPGCITLHPSFKTVCLERWSLRLAAGKYKTIDKKSYQQSGSEEA